MQQHRTIIFAVVFGGLGILTGSILYQSTLSTLIFPPTLTATVTATATRAPTRTPEPTETPTLTATPEPTLVPTATPAVQLYKLGVRPNAIVLDPSGSRLYVSDESGVIHVVTAQSPRLIADIPTASTSLSWLALHPSGDRLYATTLDGWVYAFDTTTFQIVTRARLNASYPVVRPIVISPDGARLYVPEASDKAIGMVSLESRGLGLIARFGDVRDPRFAAATRAGTRVFVPNYADNSVGVFSVTPNLQFFPAQTNRIALNGNPTSATLNRDESLLFVTLGTDPSIAVISTASLQVVKTIPMPTNLFGALLTPDGRRLIVNSNISDYTYVVDTATQQLLTSFFVGQGPRGIAVSPDSRTAYTANYLDGTISIFNLP